MKVAALSYKKEGVLFDTPSRHTVSDTCKIKKEILKRTKPHRQNTIQKTVKERLSRVERSSPLLLYKVHSRKIPAGRNGIIPIQPA